MVKWGKFKDKKISCGVKTRLKEVDFQILSLQDGVWHLTPKPDLTA